MKEKVNIEEFIEEMTKVRQEVLTPGAKSLFNTINTILDENLILKEALKDKCELADERNQLLVENQKKDNAIKNLENRNRKLDLENQKLFEQNLFQDKLIDEMVNEIFENYQSYEPCPLEDKTKCKISLNCKECIKQYFIKKAEEQE